MIGFQSTYAHPTYPTHAHSTYSIPIPDKEEILRCLFNISKCAWPLNSPDQGLGCIFPRVHSLYNPDVWTPTPFVPLAS